MSKCTSPRGLECADPVYLLTKHGFIKAFTPAKPQKAQPGYGEKCEECIEEQGQTTVKDKETMPSTMIQETADSLQKEWNQKSRSASRSIYLAVLFPYGILISIFMLTFLQATLHEGC